MNIHFVKSIGQDVEKFISLTKPIINKLFPGYQSSQLPEALMRQEIIRILEFQKSIVFVCFWHH